MPDVPVLPVYLQFTFRRQDQVPAYLRSIDPNIDRLGFNPHAVPGIEIIAKTFQYTVDMGELHAQLLANDLVLTHASRVFRPRNEESRDQHIVRFHYFPKEVARVHEAMDTDKLTQSLGEITDFGFWRVHVHRNGGDHGEWLSISCDARAQRFIGENPETPLLERTDDKGQDLPREERTYAPIEADYQFAFDGENILLLG